MDVLDVEEVNGGISVVSDILVARPGRCTRGGEEGERRERGEKCAREGRCKRMRSVRGKEGV